MSKRANSNPDGGGGVGGAIVPELRPPRPTMDMSVAPVGTQGTSTSDTDETENFLLILNKLKRAKRLIEDTKEKKRKRDILEETMSNFLREGDATVKKYAKLCQDKKKKLIVDGEKLRGEVTGILERLNRRIDNYEKFVTTYLVRLDEAERHMQSFEHKARRDVTEADRTLESELDFMRSQIDDKLQEVKRSLNRTAKKAKKKDRFMELMRQLLQDL